MNKQPRKGAPVWVKVLVPVLIVAAVGSMWLVKSRAGANETESIIPVEMPESKPAPVSAVTDFSPGAADDVPSAGNTAPSAPVLPELTPIPERPNEHEQVEPDVESSGEPEPVSEPEPEPDPAPEPEVNDNLASADFSLEVTEEVDFDELMAYGIPAIIDYGSDSCIPCQQMAPALKNLNAAMEGKAFVKFADVWKYADTPGNVPIQVIPSQIFINADGSHFAPSSALAAEIPFIIRERGGRTFTVHQGGLSEEQMLRILAEMGVE